MGKSILIIEDYPETLEMMRTVFEGIGYKVKTAETGEQAFEILARQNFDIILLDIMLPRIDGFEVCRRIKSNPKTQNIAVVATTAFDVPDIVEKCTSAGADDVLLKPFEISDLIDIIKKYVS
ncbi:MAG: response regulator [Candidatus Margulisiibacteriota bacterium]